MPTRSPRSVSGVPLPLRNYVYQNENEIRRLFPPHSASPRLPPPCRPSLSLRRARLLRLPLLRLPPAARRRLPARSDLQPAGLSLGPRLARAVAAPASANSLKSPEREDIAVLARESCSSAQSALAVPTKQTNERNRPAGQPPQPVYVLLVARSLTLAKRGSGEQSVEDILEIQCRIIQTTKSRTGFTKTTLKLNKRTFAELEV